MLSSTDFLTQSQEAINHLEAMQSLRLLRLFENGQVADPSDEEQIKNVNEKLFQLRLTAFPALSDEETANIFQQSLLAWYTTEIEIFERIQTRYLYVGAHYKNVARQILKEALLKNEEKLGPKTIGDWVRAFDTTYDVNTRQDHDILDFTVRHPEAADLGKRERAILKDILHIYDELLVTEVLDIYDLAAIERGEAQDVSGLAQKQSALNTPRVASPSPAQPSRPIQPEQIVSLPLRQALATYPALGQQIITNGSLTLKEEAAPVRGTLTNWLYAYRMAMGGNKATPVLIGRFAFNHPVTRNLSNAERERLIAFLKAFEADTLLKINVVVPEIIWDAPEPTRPTPIKLPQPPAQQSFSRPILPPVLPPVTPPSPPQASAPRPSVRFVPAPTKQLASDPWAQQGQTEGRIVSQQLSPSQSQAGTVPTAPAAGQSSWLKRIFGKKDETGGTPAAPQPGDTPNKLSGHIIDLRR